MSYNTTHIILKMGLFDIISIISYKYYRPTLYLKADLFIIMLRWVIVQIKMHDDYHSFEIIIAYIIYFKSHM